MVHALTEAHRVLKPDGLLLDIRPGPQHRRVGILHAGRWRQVAAMRETFDDDRAANAAVARVLRAGLFRREAYAGIDLHRSIDTLKEFRDWLADFVKLAELPPHDWLLEDLEQALARRRGKTKIVVRGPLEFRLLRKRPARRLSRK